MKKGSQRGIVFAMTPYLYTMCRPHQRQEVAWVKVRSPMRFSPALDNRAITQTLNL